MNHKIETGLKIICKEILGENKTLEEWSEVESSDMYQDSMYCGGFDSTEEEFTFSLYKDGKEFWFQFPLEDVIKIYDGKITIVKVREADL
jgi:hypothetical protein